MESFITIHNAYKIIAKSDFKNIDFQGQVFKYKLYLFSKHEENGLLAVQELFRNPEVYFKDIYNPIVTVDSKKYVYKEQKPCYHSNAGCERLHSAFTNFELPEQIKERGDAEIEKFRSWFIENQDLLANDAIAFVFRLEMAFKIKTNPKAIHFENGGYTDFTNFTLAELEEKIDFLIKSAGRYFYANEMNTTILRRFGKCSGIAFSENELCGNDTNYSNNEVKMFLKDYHLKFKLPLKKLLVEYYRVKLNPELKFDQVTLDELGFRKCGKCKMQEVAAATTKLHELLPC